MPGELPSHFADLLSVPLISRRTLLKTTIFLGGSVMLDQSVIRAFAQEQRGWSEWTPEYTVRTWAPDIKGGIPETASGVYIFGASAELTPQGVLVIKDFRGGQKNLDLGVRPGSVPAGMEFLSRPVSWISEGNKVAVWSNSDGRERVVIADVESGNVETIYDRQGTNDLCLVLPAPSGERFATVAINSNGQAHTLVFENGRLLRSLDMYVANLSGAAFSPDGQWLFVVSLQGQSKFINLKLGKEFIPSQLNANPASPLVWSPDSRYLVGTSCRRSVPFQGNSACVEDELLVVEPQAGKEFHLRPINAVTFAPHAFLPDGKTLLFTALDASLQKLFGFINLETYKTAVFASGNLPKANEQVRSDVGDMRVFWVADNMYVVGIQDFGAQVVRTYSIDTASGQNSLLHTMSFSRNQNFLEFVSLEWMLSSKTEGNSTGLLLTARQVDRSVEVAKFKSNSGVWNVYLQNMMSIKSGDEKEVLVDGKRYQVAMPTQELIGRPHEIPAVVSRAIPEGSSQLEFRAGDVLQIRDELWMLKNGGRYRLPQENQDDFARGRNWRKTLWEVPDAVLPLVPIKLHPHEGVREIPMWYGRPLDPNARRIIVFFGGMGVTPETQRSAFYKIKQGLYENGWTDLQMLEGTLNVIKTPSGEIQLLPFDQTNSFRDPVSVAETLRLFLQWIKINCPTTVPTFITHSQEGETVLNALTSHLDLGGQLVTINSPLSGVNRVPNPSPLGFEDLTFLDQCQTFFSGGQCNAMQYYVALGNNPIVKPNVEALVQRVRANGLEVFTFGASNDPLVSPTHSILDSSDTAHNGQSVQLLFDDVPIVQIGRRAISPHGGLLDHEPFIEQLAWVVGKP